MFSIYINDLPHAVSFSDVDLYADDTLISYSDSSLLVFEAQLQSDVDSVVSWLVSNRLWINVSKTVSMLIGSRQKVGGQQLAIAIDDKPLCTVSVTKYLGVYIDQCLTWHTHVDSILSKVRYKMYCIKRLQWISLYLFGLLYQVFIMSLFDYCAVIWCPNMNQLRIMERLHSGVTLSVSHIKKKLSSYMFLLYFTGTSTFSLSYTNLQSFA